MEDRVREFLGLFHHKTIDFDRVAACFSVDALYQPHVPDAGIVRGRETIRGELERQLTLYNECDFQITNLAFNDCQVFAERRDYVTQNGLRIEVRVNAIFEFNADHEICAWREYWDMGAVQRQLKVSEQQMASYMAQD